MSKNTCKSGSRGSGVSVLGPGCMAMSELHSSREAGEAIATIHPAFQPAGVTPLDTADMCGPYTHKALVGMQVTAEHRAGIHRTLPPAADSGGALCHTLMQELNR